MPYEPALDASERLVLREGRDKGDISLVLVREGKEDPDAAAMVELLRAMCRRSLLCFISQGGSKSRLTGAAFRVTYRATEAGLALLEAEEEVERLTTTRTSAPRSTRAR